ncbi:MAG: phosphoglucosamine mutase [Pirellulales bacterium]|nr:phosphoglucosamine mutase [Pirellulales bacterium]
MSANPQEPIISVSGLRGIVGVSLTPEVAVRYAAAYAGETPSGPIVVTHDGRATGPMLSAVVCGALAATGRKVYDAGIAATPTTGVLVREHKAAGGVQISASHNPPEYNGMKLFSSQGRVLPAAEGARVLQQYRSWHHPWVTHASVGGVQRLSDTTSTHAGSITSLVDVQLIKKKKLTVLLDSNHGSGSILARRLMEELGVRVKILGGEPNGRFEHPPEPTEDNLQSILDEVRDSRADIGFCQDPDADRLAVIDETGRYLGEEFTLALCVDHILRRRKGAVVTNCSTSRMTEDLANKYGVPFFRSAVGEANVVDVMLQQGAILGGEGNGGVIDPRVGYVRDSFVGMALILEAMCSRDKDVSQLADELPHYAIHKTKFSFPTSALGAGFTALEQNFASAAVNKLDGLRLDWPNKWLLVRASNTEPIVRAIAEAPTAKEAEELCDTAGKVLATVV